jgi:hypothetical protein
MSTGDNYCAKLITFSDLLATSDPSEYGLLRMIGKLETYDIKHSIMWIQDYLTPSLKLAISVSNIEPIPFASRLGTLYQFIGEVAYRDVPTTCGKSERTVLMTALAFRCMDGVDMGVYVRSHQARMRDLKTPVITSLTSTDTTANSN